MRGDIPAAAFRLSQQLPVRTHRKPEPITRSVLATQRRRAGVPLSEHNQPRPIRCRGKEFASIAEARKVLRASTQTIHRWIAIGYAEYIDQSEEE